MKTAPAITNKEFLDLWRLVAKYFNEQRPVEVSRVYFEAASSYPCAVVEVAFRNMMSNEINYSRVPDVVVFRQYLQNAARAGKGMPLSAKEKGEQIKKAQEEFDRQKKTIPVEVSRWQFGMVGLLREVLFTRMPSEKKVEKAAKYWLAGVEIQEKTGCPEFWRMTQDSYLEAFGEIPGFPVSRLSELISEWSRHEMHFSGQDGGISVQ